jgi:drug/metabolite transporter (DMT)-like permease
MRRFGVQLSITSAILLGMAPVLGKAAIQQGMLPLAVVAYRTAGATFLLFIVVLLFRRRFLYIFPVGLAGCLLAGGLNGIGSLFYYSALARVDASVGQLIYALYPTFVAVLLYLDGQQPSRLTIFRLALSLPAIYLLTRAPAQEVDLVGLLLMLVASILYALHIPINQRVLFEAPAPTVTMYTLFAMTAIVVPAHLIFSPQISLPPEAAVLPLAGLTLVTFLSRLSLFAGVKSIGGLQASILGLAELLVTIGLAHLWLDESLSWQQWIGAVVLMAALLLVRRETQPEKVSRTRGWLYWLRPRIPSIPQSEGQDLQDEQSSSI